MKIWTEAPARVPVARYDNLVTTETATDVLVYDTNTHHIHQLNATTAAVWRLCDGQRSVTEVARQASRELGASVDTDTAKVALTKLADAGLLADELTGELRVARRMSRRTLLQRSAIAAPILISMSAPMAAAGASACGQGCTSAQDCSRLTGCTNCVGSTSTNATCQPPNQGCNPTPCTNNGGCQGWFADPAFSCNHCLNPQQLCEDLPNGGSGGRCGYNPSQNPNCAGRVIQTQQRIQELTEETPTPEPTKAPEPTAEPTQAPPEPTAIPPEPTAVPPEPTAIPPEPTAIPPEPTVAVQSIMEPEPTTVPPA